MGGCGGNMGVWERRRVMATSHKTRKMRHIHQQICPHTVCNFTHPGKINLARDGGTTSDNHFGLVFRCQRLHLIIINPVVVFAHPVLHCVKPLARLVWRRTMGQVTTRGQVHAQYRITRLDKGLKHPLIGL